MDSLLMAMGDRLTKRRQQLRLTQEEVAERAGLTTQTISTAETGKKGLRPENIVKLCAALDISTDYLLLGKSDADLPLIAAKLSTLSPRQLRRLEDIIDIFIAAVKEKQD